MRSVAYRGGVALVAVLAAMGVLLLARPARAADVYVQVAPSIVPAGDVVGIRASCRSNWHPVTVESDAFGTATVQPHHGLLTATVTIPGQTRSGTYRVTLHCSEGPGASTRLTVTGGGPRPQPSPYPSRGPATGFGGGASGLDLGALLLPGGLGITVTGLVLAVATGQRRRTRRVPGGSPR